MPRRSHRQLVGKRIEREHRTDELELAELACELHNLQRRARFQPATAVGEDIEPESREP